jgi:hypothetical protein
VSFRRLSRLVPVVVLLAAGIVVGVAVGKPPAHHACKGKGHGHGCTSSSTGTTQPGTSSTGTSSGSSGPCGTRVGQQPSTYAHVVWIVFENKSYGEIVGNSSAPYLNGLAHACGLATNYKAVAHPSLPNYIALTSGATQGITDDNAPSSHPLSVASIFLQSGSGWRSYQESMPSSCDLTNSGEYAVKHNPAAYYTNIRTACQSQDVPLGSAISARFTFVTPNLCHDMHDCSIATGDSWLKSYLPGLLASTAYTGGGTAIFVTWDEDDGSSQNHVATLVISPYTPAGSTSSSTFNHYSLLHTSELMLGLPCLGNACTAASMRTPFGL